MGKHYNEKHLTPEQLEEIRLNRERKRAEKEEAQKAAAAKKAREKLVKRMIAAALAVSVVAAIILGVVFCNKTKNDDDTSGDVLDEAKTYIVGEGSCDYLTTRSTEGRDIKYVKLAVKGYGSMIILLDATSAPITVANFIKLVEEGFYDGLTFHRIMSGFMIQGGDPNADGTGNSSEQIKGEFSQNGWENDILHKDGVISMARGLYSMDSASCQFFICNASNYNVTYSLDGQYAAFGYVIAGLSIVHEITEQTEQYATGSSYTITDKSKQAIIESIEVITEEEALSYTK